MNDIDKIARQIVLAKANGTLLKPLDTQLSLSEAYAVQRACTHIGQTHNDIPSNAYQTVGYKIGATTKEIQDLLGLSEPFYGPLYLGASSWDDHEPASTSFSVYMQHNTRVEAEFVVCLKDDLVWAGNDFQIEDLAHHVDWIAPGLEFVGSRFEVTGTPRGTTVIADMGSNQFMLVGKACKNWQQYDLTSLGVNLGFTNMLPTMAQWPEPVVHGHSGMSVFGSPLAMVCWLLNHQSMRDIGLKAGEWVSCGTCTGALPVEENQNKVAADFGELGKVIATVGAYHNQWPDLI